jgi:serpin B
MNMPFNFARICAVVITAVALQAHSAGGTDMKPLVDGNTAFALQLYGKLQPTGGNLVFSPYSISSALAMTYAGARGETALQMKHALHFDKSETRLHPLFSQLDAALKAAQGRNELSMANSLWPEEKYPFHDEFLSLLKNDYGATVTPLDFGRDANKARTIINRWVDGKTRHKITEIIGPGVLDEMTRMVLVNAIYFKGTWATPFAASATQPDKFYTKPGTTITVPFMHTGGHFGYGEADQLQVLALPYIGQKLEMIILLPRNRDSLAKLESNLNPASLASWLEKAEDQSVNVTLPKFKMSTGLVLSNTLQAMGMKDAFSADADFSGMDGTPHWLYLSAVLHKAQIDVNEKGTEAAAATGVGVTELGAMRVEEPPREFRADHPFLFLIQDTTTDSILFMGRVMNPGD